MSKGMHALSVFCRGLFFLVLACVAAYAGSGTAYGSQGGPSAGAARSGAAVPDQPVRVEIAPEGLVDDTFRSHLPLLVISPQADAAVTGGAAVLRLYDAPSRANSPRDVPAAALEVLLAAAPDRDAPAPTGKKTYSVRLAPSLSVEDRAIALAGLPASSRWTLRGSVRDKGMLRNGLAYAFGRVIFPESTPRTRYCELLLEEGGRYAYQGIYILAEAVPPSGDEGNALLLEYAPNALRLGNKPGGKEGAIGDDVFLSRTLGDRGFSIIREGDAPRNRELRMEAALDSLESVLHSLTPDIFLTYDSLLDQRSAIDLYILNELMLNAQNAPVPFLLGAQEGSGLQIRPVWRFDEALDNASVRTRPPAFEEDAPVVTAPSALAKKVPVWRRLENGGGIENLRLYPLYAAMNGDRYLWFDRLFLSRPFLSDLNARYRELRRGPLSPERVGGMVDAIAGELGPALARDWVRWGAEYAGDDGPFALAPYVDAQGESRIRQTHSYDEELVKIRHLLREQDAFFLQGVTNLERAGADLFDHATSGNRQAGLAIAAIIAFLILTHLLTRKV